MYRKILIYVSLFVLAVFLIGTNLGKPFWGTHDWNGARYGNIAKNYLRYGLIETKFGQVENGGISKPADFVYYTHYQPLLPLLIAGSYKILGISEFATRLIPLFASAGLIVVLYLIGSTLFSEPAGVFCALIALFTPMLRYYGKNPVHEPLAAFFGALAFYGAILVKKKYKYGWHVLIAGLILTALTNWSFVFLVFGLTVFLFEKKYLKNIIRFWVLAVTLGLLQFLHAYILTGSIFGGGLIGALLLRTSLDQSTTSFNIFQYLSQVRLWSSTLFTNTLLVSSLAGILLLIKKKNPEIIRFIAGAFIFSFYSNFFANASFIHSYFIYYFVFPLAVSSAYLFYYLLNIKKLRKWRMLLITLFLLILAGVYLERNSYVSALNVSEGDKLSVEIGKLLKIASKPKDTVLIEPAEYAESRLPMLSYYSERNIAAKAPADWKVVVSGDSFNAVKLK